MRILTTFRLGQILIWSTRKISIKTSRKNKTQYVKAVVRPSKLQSNLFRNHLTFTLLPWLPLNNKIIILTILSHIITTVIFCQFVSTGTDVSIPFLTLPTTIHFTDHYSHI